VPFGCRYDYLAGGVNSGKGPADLGAERDLGGYL